MVMCNVDSSFPPQLQKRRYKEGGPNANHTEPRLLYTQGMKKGSEAIVDVL